MDHPKQQGPVLALRVILDILPTPAKVNMLLQMYLVTMIVNVQVFLL